MKLCVKNLDHIRNITDIVQGDVFRFAGEVASSVPDIMVALEKKTEGHSTWWVCLNMSTGACKRVFITSRKRKVALLVIEELTVADRAIPESRFNIKDEADIKNDEQE